MRYFFPLLFASLALAKPVLFQNEDSYSLYQAYLAPENNLALGLPGDDNKSIYDVLKADEEFSYITKAIEFTETVDFYKDSSLSITFFAPPNKAFPKRPDHDEDDHGEDMLIADPGRLSLDVVMSRVESLDTSNMDDKDKERRRKILKRIAHAILSYHTLPNTIDSTKLAVNTTQPTALILPKEINYAQPLRIKVSTGAIHPTVRLNLITRVVESDVTANNGLIHVISFPLIPPFPAFAELFQVPSAFSTFTSAIQRTRLADELDIRFVHGKEKKEDGGFVGARAITVFAPTNKAFERLPKKLQFFLFSPLGTHVLRKLLQFHIVPDYVIHSDFAYNATSKAEGYEVVPPRPEPIFDVKKSLPTLLKDHSVEIHVTKYTLTLPIPGPKPTPPRVITKFEVEGRKIGLGDIPAANGAVHIVDHVLNPKKRHEHDCKHSHPRVPQFNYLDSDDSWNDWADWLVDWATQV